ncbi:hypothetical protein GFB56_26595 [Ensifer sp. T173]|uniref:Membrane-anchored protein n=1 Tax=Ensifer canadensis TaxID=555315 RepID=A0AAW4FSG8_9HYPH|nr:hypothetical protein [Ensifer canadensis]MBM3094317.1 hypothetical protein [Ensifer canadensis]UBI80538.1 hypothetical protein J3R84_37410 [Ensifer canadensis]
MTSEIATIETLRESHRHWLSSLGILDTPWLIFGSAPGPTLPPDLIEYCARVDVNNSGKTANALGLPPADLTFRKRKKSWGEHPYVRTRGLLWLHRRPLWVMHMKLLLKPSVRYKSLMRATKAEREAIVNFVSGGVPGDVGDVGKVTNGVAALCYGLFVGVPSVTLTGFSLTQMGHSYNDKGKVRRQIAEDTFVLTRLRDRGNIFTTESELSEETGLPFVRNRGDITDYMSRRRCADHLDSTHI